MPFALLSALGGCYHGFDLGSILLPIDIALRSSYSRSRSTEKLHTAMPIPEDLS